jgi:hypothetical protein
MGYIFVYDVIPYDFVAKKSKNTIQRRNCLDCPDTILFSAIPKLTSCDICVILQQFNRFCKISVIGTK